MNKLKKLGFLSIYLMLICSNTIFILSKGQFTWTGIIFTFLIVPLADSVLGRDSQNVSHDDFENLVHDRFFDFVVYSLVYAHFLQLVLVSFTISKADFSAFQWVGFVLSIGIFSGTMINVAHELGHRNSKIAQFHAKFTLMTVCYMHFIIEHNRGHHVWVATPQDPATAKRGQSLYEFWVQSIVGSFRSAWNIETQRLQRTNLLVISIYNQMLWFVALPLLFCIAMTTFVSIVVGFWAWQVVILFFAQSIVAVLLLETVNYIEHYGIVRRELGVGRYERVNPLHSWNANHIFSNLVLFQLQRHSDHHAHASRPYQVLRHFDQSPQLPFGYPVMILLALVPPIWFKTMNTRLEKWQLQAYDAQHIHQIMKQYA